MKSWNQLTLEEKIAYCCKVRLPLRQAEAKYLNELNQSKLKENEKF